MKVKELFEGKQVGTLYHFTSYNALLGILAEDEIMLDAYGRVSLTRSKTFDINPRMSFSTGKTAVTITLDGDKLSEKYAVKPFNYFFRNNLNNIKSLRTELQASEQRLKEYKKLNYKTHVKKTEEYIKELEAKIEKEKNPPKPSFDTDEQEERLEKPITQAGKYILEIKTNFGKDLWGYDERIAKAVEKYKSKYPHIKFQIG